jgi:hypothetical protein
MFADGSEYCGNFNFGVFHGYGRYSWAKEPTGSSHTDLHCGHSYTGDWVDGSMDGKGEFRHRDGHVLAPHFKNNLFFIPEGSNCAINPFKSKPEIEAFLERIRSF